MLKRGFISLGFIGLCVAVLSIASSPAVDAATSGASMPAADSCGVVSCTIYLPLMVKPVAATAPIFEVTQGVQQPDNSVRLIGQRPTYVRWTLTSPVTESGVSAYLVATRDGVPLAGSPLAALNNPRTLKASADRAVLNDTFNFQLPTDWANGSLTLNAYASSSTGFITNTLPQSFQFQATSAMAVKVVPIAYHCTSGGTGTTTPAGPYDYLIDYTFRTYPVPAIALTTHTPVPFDGPCNGSGVPKPASTDWSDMLDTVTSVWQVEGSPNIYYYGLVHIDCGSSCIAGIGWIGWPAAMGFDGFGATHSGASSTNAHEMGHNHGRYHAPGCGAGGASTFPYLDGSGRAVIGNAANPNYGFDLNSRAIYTYGGTFDFMTYCNPTWVSDFTYEALWQFDNVALAARPITTVADRSFLISGAIDPNTSRVDFHPTYALDLPARLPDPGDYVLELIDAHSQVIAAYPFSMITATPDTLDATSTNTYIGFHLTVPYVEGVSALRVRRGDVVLGSQLAGSTILAAPNPERRESSIGPAQLVGREQRPLSRTSVHR